MILLTFYLYLISPIRIRNQHQAELPNHPHSYTSFSSPYVQLKHSGMETQSIRGHSPNHKKIVFCDGYVNTESNNGRIEKK